MTADLFGENIIDGTDPFSETPIGSRLPRRERASPEMGTVVISDDGEVRRFQQAADQGTSNQTMGEPFSREQFASETVWRKSMIPYIINNTNLLHKNILGKGKKRQFLSSSSALAPDAEVEAAGVSSTANEQEVVEDSTKKEESISSARPPTLP